MGRLMRKVIRRVETIVAWIIALVVVFLLVSGAWWVLGVV